MWCLAELMAESDIKLSIVTRFASLSFLPPSRDGDR